MLETPSKEARTAFVKLYPPQTFGKALFNEIAGFLFTSATGVPQPDQGWLVYVPLKQVPPADRPPWLQDLADRGLSAWPGWATARVNGTAAAVHFTGGQSLSPGSPAEVRLVEDIKGWSSLPEAVSLDNTLTNVDRHFNNLLRLGRNSYCLIDNGRLAHQFGMWDAAALNSSEKFPNKLCQFVWKSSPEKDELDKAALGAREHLFCYHEISDELRYWGERLLDPTDSSAFCTFLEERATAAETLLKDRYGTAA